jgi:hypothetical protein
MTNSDDCEAYKDWFEDDYDPNTTEGGVDMAPKRAASANSHSHGQMPLASLATEDAQLSSTPGTATTAQKRVLTSPAKSPNAKKKGSSSAAAACSQASSTPAHAVSAASRTLLPLYSPASALCDSMPAASQAVTRAPAAVQSGGGVVRAEGTSKKRTYAKTHAVSVFDKMNKTSPHADNPGIWEDVGEEELCRRSVVERFTHCTPIHILHSALHAHTHALTVSTSAYEASVSLCA